MLETLNDWNIWEQIACGTLTVFIVCTAVYLLWCHVNVEKVTDSNLDVENAKKKSEAKLKEYKKNNPLPLSKCIDLDLKHDVVMGKKK